MASDHQSHRKLAAILFADIAGYSTMMQRSEELALAILSRYETVTANHVAKNEGEVIKTYGDGSLILFDSAVSAVKCAQEMQVEFRKDPIVPLRIGVHVGEIIYKGKDIFGDGVNIASRVESMCIPGAVLLSKSTHDSVKNQESISTESMGSYHFKNIIEPIEVFALSNDGFPIPKKKELEGKFEGNNRRKNFSRNVFAASSFVLLAFLVGFKYLKNNSSTAHTEEIREKRLAVLNFKNQTNNSEFDVFGNMIADWLTRGLLETNEANIVNASNFQSEIAEANLGPIANPKFSNETGIDLIIDGAYYLAESRMIIIADLIEVSSGEILHSHRVDQPQGANMQLLEELTEDVVSYWVVKDNIQLRQRPPNFESYKLYIQGNNIYDIGAEEAIELYQRSFALDTTFLSPLLRSSSLYLNLGNTEKSNEIMDYLSDKKDVFSKFEKLDYDIRIANKEHNYIRAAKLSEEKLRLDPRDDKANYNVAYFYALANYPMKSLEALANYIDEIKDYTVKSNWNTTLKCYALKRSNQCDQVNSIVGKTEFQKFSVILAVMDLQCLVEMDSLDKALEKLKYYNEIGVYNPVGAPANTELLPIVCNKMLIEGHATTLNKLHDKLEIWVKQVSAIPYLHLAPDLFNNRPYRINEARGYFQFYLGNLNAALDNWLDEKIPASNWPDLLEHASRLGYLFAKTDNELEARKYLSLIDEMNVDNTYFRPNQLYFRSRILSGLSNVEAAINSLERSLQAGMIMYRPSVFQDDPFLMDIHQASEFQALIKPKS